MKPAMLFVMGENVFMITITAIQLRHKRDNDVYDYHRYVAKGYQS